MKFQEGFLWGGATAAHQYEGGYLEGGRTPSTADAITGGGYKKARMMTYVDANGQYGQSPIDSSLTGVVPKGSHGVILEDTFYPSHEATDFYHHWKEDIALFAEMGFKCYRMSMSWTRVCPNGLKEVNEEGLHFYDQVIDELLSYDIVPLVTMNHFDMPLYLADHYDGFRSRCVIDYFLFFVKTILERYKGKVTHWITFNEINVLTGWPQIGIHGNDPQDLYQAHHHIFLASAKAVKLAHEIDPNNKVGMMVAYTPSYPMTCKPEDVLGNIQFNRQKNFYMDVQVNGFYPNYWLKEFERLNVTLEMEDDDLDILKDGTADFIAFSYYMSTVFTTDENAERTEGNQFLAYKNPYLKTSDWGWTIDPLGLRIALCEVYERYHIPVFVVENGIGLVDTISEDGHVHDPERISYLKAHIEAMRDAVNYDGVDLMGYTTWGCIDIVSAGTGEMKKRYGFIYVDRYDDNTGDFKRIKKDSFDWYKKVIKTNGETL